MKAPRRYVVLGLVALLGVGGALRWRQFLDREEAKVRLLAAENEAAQRQARDDAQAQTAARQKATTAANEAAVATPPDQPREAARADGKITVDKIQQWLADANDPVVMRRLSIQARNQTLQRYAALFTQLNLPAEQTDAFIKLLINKRQAAMDLIVASLQQGDDPTNDLGRFGRQVTASKAEIENQVHALLGDEIYAQYQSYDQNFAHASVLNNLQTALVSSGEPLTPEQAARMTQLLEQTNAQHVTPEVVAGAKEFLSPVQTEALQDLRAIFLAEAQKRLRPGQILPTDPKPPAGKP